MENFWEIISGAPWWVYILFVYVVYRGIKSIKPSSASIKKVVFLPLLFVSWGLQGLYKNFMLGFVSLIPLGVIFFSLGAYWGMQGIRSWRTSEGKIWIPGSYSTLVLTVLLFILKFYCGYLSVSYTEISYWIYFLDTLTSSLVIGFFVGRAWILFKSYYKRSVDCER